MIALLSLAALSGLGYLTSKNKLYENNILFENSNDQPSNSDQYNSNYNQQQNKQLQQKRQTEYEISKDPLQTGVYNDAYRQNVNQILLNNNINPEQEIVSSLSGQQIKQKDFHSNMMPNIKKSVGNTRSNEYQQRQLELFTGQNPLSQQKQELTPLFRTTGYDPTDEMKDRFETARERAYVSKIQNNTLPFEQVRVQRGIGLGTDNVNYLGFQQPNINDIVKPKTVDDLRIATKNKVEYKKPVNAGVMPSQGQRPKLGQVVTQNKKNYQPRDATFIPGGTIQKQGPRPAVQPLEKSITQKYQQNNTYQPQNMQSNKYLPTSQIVPEPGVYSMTKQRKDPETFVQGTQRNIAADQAYDISKQDYGKSGIRVDNTNRGQDIGFGLVSNAHKYNRAQPRNYQPPMENRKQFLELNPRMYNQVQTGNSMQKYAFNQKEQQQNLQPTLKDTVQFGTSINQEQGLNKNQQELGFYTQRGFDTKEQVTNREIDQFNNVFGIADGYQKQTLRGSEVTKCPIGIGTNSNYRYGTPFVPEQNQFQREMQNNEITKNKLNQQQQNNRISQLEQTHENLLQQDGYRHIEQKQSVRPAVLCDNMFRQDLDTSDMVTQGLSFTQGPKQHNTYVNNTQCRQKYTDIKHANTQYPQQNNDYLLGKNTQMKQCYPDNQIDTSIQNQLKSNPYSIKK